MVSAVEPLKANVLRRFDSHMRVVGAENGFDVTIDKDYAEGRDRGFHFNLGRVDGLRITIGFGTRNLGRIFFGCRPRDTT